jgi:nucleotide-binding universal stress UspA family protein
MAAYKWTDLSPRHTLTLGVLMNTRGLMELVILNVALSVGAIGAPIFSMMVIMTLFTTMMTTPLVKLLYSKEERRTEFSDPLPTQAGPQVLVSVARPERVPGLMKIAAMLLGKTTTGRMLALHVDRAEDHEHRVEQQDLLKVAEAAAKDLAPDFPVANTLQTVSLISDQIPDEIIDLAAKRNVSWIVMGWHKPIFDHSVLGGTVARVMKESHAGVAVFVDKGLSSIRRVLVPYLGDQQDTGVLVAAELLSQHPGVEVTILHLVSAERRKAAPLGVSSMIDTHSPRATQAGNVHFQVVESASPIDKVAEESHRYDLIVLGLSPAWQWGERGGGGAAGGWLTAKQESVAQQSMCSLLIVRASPKLTSSGVGVETAREISTQTH